MLQKVVADGPDFQQYTCAQVSINSKKFSPKSEVVHFTDSNAYHALTKINHTKSTFFFFFLESPNISML